MGIHILESAVAVFIVYGFMVTINKENSDVWIELDKNVELDKKEYINTWIFSHEQFKIERREVNYNRQNFSFIS